MAYLTRSLRFMQQVIRINAIRDRATALGVSIKALCGDAGVSYSAPYRWLAGRSEPGLLRYEAVCGALEGALRRREAKLRRVLEAAE